MLEFMIARPHIANMDQATKQKYCLSIKCMTDIAVNWSLYGTCIPHNPADGPRGRRVSTDCRGRLGGTGVSPTIQLILLRSHISASASASINVGLLQKWSEDKTERRELQPVTVDSKQAGGGERRE